MIAGNLTSAQIARFRIPKRRCMDARQGVETEIHSRHQQQRHNSTARLWLEAVEVALLLQTRHERARVALLAVLLLHDERQLPFS